MLDVTKLYPQYSVIKDRRQNSVDVENDRRSGADRRTDNRVYMDTKLTRDLYDVRNRLSSLQRPSVHKEMISFKQNISNAAQMSLKTDQFVKSNNDNVQNRQEIPKDKSQTAPLVGVLSSMLGGIVVSTMFMGTAAVGIALGLGAYFGGKLLKSAITTHLRR